MDMIIRPMEEQDVPAVTEILIHEIASEAFREQVAPFFKQVKNDENYQTFVATLNQEVVGFVSTTTMLWPGRTKVNTTLFVQCIAVKREYQHQGIGTKLLAHIEEYAKAKEILGVGLQSGASRTAAHACYEKNGYIRSNYYYKNFDIKK